MTTATRTGNVSEKREIHRGPTTVVYRGTWTDAGGEARAVVVKTVDPDAVDAGCIARWTHEARVLERVRAHGGPTMHAFVVERGIPVLVLEDRDGIALR